MGVDCCAVHDADLPLGTCPGATEKQPTLPNAFSLDAAVIVTASIARDIAALEHRRDETKRNETVLNETPRYGAQRRCTRFPFGFLPKQTVR